MSVENSIAALIRSFLGRDSRQQQVRVLVESLWDWHKFEVRASFRRALECSEDSTHACTHHINRWQELLHAVGSKRRLG